MRSGTCLSPPDMLLLSQQRVANLVFSEQQPARAVPGKHLNFAKKRLLATQMSN